MNQPNMIRAKGDGIEIQLCEWAGQGRPVLCVHGLTANCRCFDVIASTLAPRHRILAVDLRGRGLSDKPETGYSIEHHCRDLEAVLRGLGLDKITLLGHSLGAFISLAFAATRTNLVEGIIMMDGGAPLSLEQWGKIATAIKPSTDRLTLTFPSFEAYLEHVKQAAYLEPWNQAIEDYFRYECHEVDGVVRSRIKAENIQEETANILAMDATQYYPKVKCPVLVIRATQGMVVEDDLVMPEEATAELQKLLPQTKVVSITGANHYSILFQPIEERTRAILDFLAG